MVRGDLWGMVWFGRLVRWLRGLNRPEVGSGQGLVAIGGDEKARDTGGWVDGNLDVQNVNVGFWVLDVSLSTGTATEPRAHDAMDEGTCTLDLASSTWIRTRFFFSSRTD